MGVARYDRWALVIVALVFAGCAAKATSMSIQVPPDARCYLKTMEDRQVAVCVCDGECWEQLR